MTNAYDTARAVRADLLREARIDVRNYGFIGSTVAASLEHAGVDVAQLERDLLDAAPTHPTF